MTPDSVTVPRIYLKMAIALADENPNPHPAEQTALNNLRRALRASPSDEQKLEINRRRHENGTINVYVDHKLFGVAANEPTPPRLSLHDHSTACNEPSYGEVTPEPCKTCGGEGKTWVERGDEHDDEVLVRCPDCTPPEPEGAMKPTKPGGIVIEWHQNGEGRACIYGAVGGESIGEWKFEDAEDDEPIVEAIYAAAEIARRQGYAAGAEAKRREFDELVKAAKVIVARGPEGSGTALTAVTHLLDPSLGNAKAAAMGLQRSADRLATALTTLDSGEGE